MTAFLTTLPWLALLAALPLALNRRPSLLSYPPARPDPPAPPLVSVIVPTRDDGSRIGGCLSSLLSTQYPAVEVLVVDQASVDGTREVVEAIAARERDRVRLLDAGPVPEGWTGRSWACWRGQAEAAGELLLFTDPDTRHAPALLPRAVMALETERADLLGVLPRLTVTGFWQRLLVPHIWLLLAARFPSARFVNRNRRPADAVAPREFMLFRRDALRSLLATPDRGVAAAAAQLAGADFPRTLAPRVVAAGRRLFLVHGESLLETRIHGTLSAIAGEGEGGGDGGRRLRVAQVPWTGAVLPWLLALAPLVLFVVPPLLVIGGWVTGGLAGMPGWAVRATALSMLFWLVVYASYRIRPAYVLAYPLGAAVTAVIFGRAVLKRNGRRGSPPAAPDRPAR